MCRFSQNISEDLKEAYFHIQIAPWQRHFLRFAFEGTAYHGNDIRASTGATHVYEMCGCGTFPSESKRSTHLELSGQLAGVGPLGGSAQQPQMHSVASTGAVSERRLSENSEYVNPEIRETLGFPFQNERFVKPEKAG